MEVMAGVHEKGAASLDDIIGSVRANSEFWKAGAIGIFIGVVRGQSLKGERVSKLELEAYEEKADEVLRGICRDLKKREGVVDVQIHHLIGEFDVGEDLVYVVVAGAHRNDLLPALREAIERYKKEAPIFKKEYTIDGKGEARSLWVSEEQ
ncbi:MAG: molybdenum cofactor biosynthesis protein MoaE [Candidatus Bathyarchaeota archaeon]|nr:molybdenum cofactor biosynthesis protein MoaE [Candidatus Bathyarchaeota archaeon]